MTLSRILQTTACQMYSKYNTTAIIDYCCTPALLHASYLLLITKYDTPIVYNRKEKAQQLQLHTLKEHRHTFVHVRYYIRILITFWIAGSQKFHVWSLYDVDLTMAESTIKIHSWKSRAGRLQLRRPSQRKWHVWAYIAKDQAPLWCSLCFSSCGFDWIVLSCSVRQLTCRCT